jgi:hypothetical protein
MGEILVHLLNNGRMLKWNWKMGMEKEKGRKR